MPTALPTTQWSLVLAAGGQAGSAESAEALAVLCERYWYPVYAYVRTRGYQPSDAQDLTQEFFRLLLEKKYLRGADPERGRFRSFLLGSVRHFLSNQRDRERAQKRGGGSTFIPLRLEDAEGRYGVEPSHGMTPERIFERTWALTLLDRVFAQIEEEYRRAGKTPVFNSLKRYLTDERLPYNVIAPELSMTEAAVKVAVHRLRRRFRDMLRKQVADTVASPEEIDQEIRSLLATIAGR